MDLKWILTDFRHAIKTSATSGSLPSGSDAISNDAACRKRKKMSQRFTFADLDFILKQHAQHDPCRSERKMSKEKLLWNCSIKLC